MSVHPPDAVQHAPVTQGFGSQETPSPMYCAPGSVQKCSGITVQPPTPEQQAPVGQLSVWSVTEYGALQSTPARTPGEKKK
ncbi:MAG: hypothetical protein H6816_15570 [Phycisphaerales bacterium]|nr:hypothetical protein [Phycisphaerales bacterium]